MSEMKLETKGSLPKAGEFDQGRFWFSRRGNVLTLGLTSHGLDSLGDLEEIQLPDEGEHLDAGDEIAVIDGTRGSLELALPSKGLVLEVNPVASDPAVVAEDPLEAGWLVRYQIEDLESLSDL